VILSPRNWSVILFSSRLGFDAVANEFRGGSTHSAEYFGDTRDHWWNEEFLRLVSARWNADQVREALDVGCGVGHWSRLLLRVLGDHTSVTGVDREAIWIEHARARATQTASPARFRYEVGTIERLPFPDASFDLVTCQTVLIHVADPNIALAEMVRVLRPNGLVLVAEPTNAGNATVGHSIALRDSPADTASLFQFHLVCLRGKALLGEGDELIGERLPALLTSAGLHSVELRLNDRPFPMVPPYGSPEQEAAAEEMISFAARGTWVWNREQTRRYFAAGGGKEQEFDANWAAAVHQWHRAADAIVSRRYATAGGGLFYLAWGRKAVT
jgi:SAM-dependent methyltransferase